MISERATVKAAHIILASGSPRRVEILNDILGLAATVVPSNFPEDLDKSQYTPAAYVQENARQKALEVYDRLTSEKGSSPSLVVGADTVVVLGDAILEKPKSTGAPRLSPCLTVIGHTLAAHVFACAPTRALLLVSAASLRAIPMFCRCCAGDAIEAQRQLARGLHWGGAHLRPNGCWLCSVSPPRVMKCVPLPGACPHASE